MLLKRSLLHLPPPVQNRPRVVDGVNADGIGIEGLSVRKSGTPPSRKGTFRIRRVRYKAGIIMRATLHECARNTY